MQSNWIVVAISNQYTDGHQHTTQIYYCYFSFFSVSFIMSNYGVLFTWWRSCMYHYHRRIFIFNWSKSCVKSYHLFWMVRSLLFSTLLQMFTRWLKWPFRTIFMLVPHLFSDLLKNESSSWTLNCCNYKNENHFLFQLHFFETRIAVLKKRHWFYFSNLFPFP